jgi:ADP-heptose:LPS heptosyltransferase
LLRAKGGLSEADRAHVATAPAHFDMALAFSPSRTSVMLAWSSGSATRVGLNSAKMEALLTHRVLDEGPATIETYLNMVRAVGCNARGSDYRGLLQVGTGAQHGRGAPVEAAQSRRPFHRCCTAAGCASPRQRNTEWPATHWAQAVDELALRLPVVLLGATPTPSVMRQTKNDVVDLGWSGRFANPGGDLWPRAFVPWRRFGMMHLAAAMGTSVVGIFGPTDWRATGPRGVAISHAAAVECAPCLLSHASGAAR